MVAAGLNTACITKVFSDAKPYSRGARWHQRRPGKYRKRRMALAHVRYGERFPTGSATRRNRVYVSRSGGCGVELEHLGCVQRTDAGKIYQRRFGGHTTDYAKGDMAYGLPAADRTGPRHPATLYQQC